MSAMKSAIRELRQAVLTGMTHSRDKLHQLADHLTDHLDNVVRQVRARDTFDDAPGGVNVRPYRPVRGEDGLYKPGSLPSKDELRLLTRTERDSAFYWSGQTADGIGVGPEDSMLAEAIASESGGQTLEQTLRANGVDPTPVWNPQDPEVIRFWEEASAAFAENASGDVRAVIGSNLREGNVWQTVEVPRLIDNPEVTSISQLDPDTGIWSTL